MKRELEKQSKAVKGKGKISINFANEDELERIIGLFDKIKSEE